MLEGCRAGTGRRHNRVLAALAAAAKNGCAVSVAAIARRARVDRTFLHRHRDLLGQVHAQAAEPPPAPGGRGLPSAGHRSRPAWGVGLAHGAAPCRSASRANAFPFGCTSRFAGNRVQVTGMHNTLPAVLRILRCATGAEGATVMWVSAGGFRYGRRSAWATAVVAAGAALAPTMLLPGAAGAGTPAVVRPRQLARRAHSRVGDEGLAQRVGLPDETAAGSARTIWPEL